MSVFAVHPERPSRRGLVAVLAFAAVLAGGVLATQQFPDVLPTAAELNALQAPRLVSSPEPTETTFPEPIPVDIEARIVAVLVSGEGLALKRADTGEMVQAYFPAGTTTPVTEGPVHLVGRWVGISCAYANALFEGHCTPNILIDTIAALEIVPE